MFDYQAQSEHYQNQYSAANEYAFQARANWICDELSFIADNIPAAYVTLLPESTEVSAVFLCVVTPDNIETSLKCFKSRGFEEYEINGKIIFQSFVPSVGALNIMVDIKKYTIKLTFNT